MEAGDYSLSPCQEFAFQTLPQLC